MRRVVLLMGGNAAGKTTTMMSAKLRCRTPRVRWVEADYDLSVPGPQQDVQIRQWWDETKSDVLVLCGMRIYSSLFRVALQTDVRRGLYVALFLQKPEEGRRMIRARCEKRGKDYHEWFWEDPGTDMLFGDRYHRGWRKFLRQGGAALPHAAQEFMVTPTYRVLPEVRDWLVAAVNGSLPLAPWPVPPALPKTPLRRFSDTYKQSTLLEASLCTTAVALGEFCRTEMLEFEHLKRWAAAYPQVARRGALKKLLDG